MGRLLEMQKNMSNVNQQFIFSMLIILTGYICKRFGIINEQDGEGISKIVFNLTLPALVINTLNTMKVDFSLILLPVIHILFGTIMAGLALYVFRKEPRNTRGMLSMLIPGFNVGLFAYPLVESLWGEKGVQYFAVFDLGGAITIFGVCYMLAGYFSLGENEIGYRTVMRKMSRSVPLITYLLALSVNLSGLHFPGMLIDVSKILSKANMPLSLLLLGIYLNFSFERFHLNNMLRVLLIRYAADISAGVLLYYLLPFGSLFKYTLLIWLTLPIGASVIPYSVEFGYDTRFVGTVTNITIMASFFLMWLATNFLAL